MPWQPFTKETAKAASIKGTAAMRARRDVASRLDALFARVAKLERNGHSKHKPQPIPAPLMPPPSPPADSPTANPGSFAGSRLEQVRGALRRLDARLQVEQDPLSLDRLARAAAALSVQEFALAGRPMPGQRRPGPARPTAPAAEVRPISRADSAPPEEAPPETPDDLSP